MKQLSMFLPQLGGLPKSNGQITKNSVSVNSINSYREEISKGKINSLSTRVVQLLKVQGEMTSREISKALNCERCSITNPIKSLEENGSIEIGRVAPCKITGRRVNYYRIPKVNA